MVNQGPNASNHIRATCNGSDLTLEVNGQVIGTANAIPGGGTSGAIAFAAISFESAEPSAEVQFDNMVVAQP